MISVIVPIYNIEEYLKKCVDSIIRQTYSDLDIILVDDGSTDSSPMICDNYARYDTRVRVIHQENRGLVAARKTGLALAKGEYVIFVDGDDDIRPMLCEKMLNYIQYYSADFVHANYWINNEKISSGIISTQIIEEYDFTIQQRLDMISKGVLNYSINEENGNAIKPSIWSKIFRKEFIVECYNLLDDNSSFGEDLICLCHMIMRTKKAAFVTDAFYNYNERNNSLSHTFDAFNFIRISDLYKNVIKIFDEYNCTNQMEQAINYYYKTSVIYSLERLNMKNGHINCYYYYNIQDIKNKRIIIYGGGKVGRDYYDQMSRYEEIKIVAWVDKKSDIIQYDYHKVVSPSEIKNYEYDYIIIAVLEEGLAKEIKDDLISYGIDNNSILYNKPSKCFEGIINN